MTDSNSTALRGALARAIKSHVEMKGLNGVQAAKECGIANSRMSTILRGQVEKISSDALVDILGTLGYRLDSVIGATEGHEFALKAYEKGEFEKFDDNLEAYTVEAPSLTVDEKYEIGELAMTEVGEIVLVDEIDPDADRVIADA